MNDSVVPPSVKVSLATSYACKEYEMQSKRKDKLKASNAVLAVILIVASEV